MLRAVAPEPAPGRRRRTRRWRPGALTLLIAVLGIAGLGAGLYPMTAAWMTSYNQSKVVTDYGERVQQAKPTAEVQLRRAQAYNDALTAGVVLASGASVPTGTGTSTAPELDYAQLLRANSDGLMARIRIPTIDVDLPVYHGTSEEVLLEGAGHLEGSSLPIGGSSTRSVITGHRGLASATMFTNLDRVAVGDTFTVETFGRVLTYRVRETKVIAPDDTDTLRVEPGEDLVTLITCTPLGINTHRIVVTGERITPTPPKALRAAQAAPTIPGFPWWAVIGGAGLALVGGYTVFQGFGDARARERRGRREPGGRRIPADRAREGASSARS